MVVHFYLAMGHLQVLDVGGRRQLKLDVVVVHVYLLLFNLGFWKQV